MASIAARRSVPQAMREIKLMNYQGEGWEPVREATRRAMAEIFEERMKRVRRSYLQEVRAQGLDDRCNGYFKRHLLTSIGDIELSVPRTRTFSAATAIRAYSRREERVDRLILGCFVFGHSTRKVGSVLLSVLEEKVSPSTISRVAKTLDSAVAAFHRRPIEDRYKVLVLDGVVLARKSGAGALRRPVLVALGITEDGRREILDFRLAGSESQAAWETFLTDLYNRGLIGENLDLIVTDGGGGLKAALPTVFPNIPVQRCWAHKTRNILDKVKKADREAAKKDLHRISHAKTWRHGRRAARRFSDRWEQRYPRAVACLRKDLDELLEFLRFGDPSWHKAIRTTNAIERRFKEVRRRTRPMGVFSDRTSMDRILFAVFTHENQKEGTGAPFLLTQNS
jgi:putative transposase